jgi:hypothetical protein
MPKLYPNGIEKVDQLPDGGRVYYLTNGDRITLDNIMSAQKKYKILRKGQVIGVVEHLATGLRVANETKF